MSITMASTRLDGSGGCSLSRQNRQLSRPPSPDPLCRLTRTRLGPNHTSQSVVIRIDHARSTPPRAANYNKYRQIIRPSRGMGLGLKILFSYHNPWSPSPSQTHPWSESDLGSVTPSSEPVAATV